MIADAIKQAQGMHRHVLEETYDGVCTIYMLEHRKNPDTKVMEGVEVKKLLNQPCHLSYSGTSSTISSETVAIAKQTIKLFLSPEIQIEPGSKIEVTQNGRTEVYTQSGKPAVHSSHQEVLLELWKGYA